MADSRVVVLLGMHRSGTSLTASILEAMGVDFGGDLLPANENNPRGYFEDAAISRVHIRINRLLNRRPFTPPGLADYPDSFWGSSQAEESIDELEMLLRKRLERCNGIWGFKDPHAGSFLPLWKEVFRRVGVEPVYLLAVRHPSEVAASIQKRDRMRPAQAELLWVDQNVSTLLGSEFNIAAVIDYAQWFSEPVQQAQRVNQVLGLVKDSEGAGIENLLKEKIDPGLRHRACDGETLLPIAGELYEKLLSVTRGADIEAATRPIVERYRAAKQLFEPAFDIIARENTARRNLRTELAVQREESQREINGLRRRLKNIETLTRRFLESRTGIIARQYQMNRKRLLLRDPEQTLLVELKKLVDRE
jgi:hypothetical protein